MGITVISVHLVQLPGQLFWLWALAFSGISPPFRYFFFSRSVRGVCSSRVRNWNLFSVAKWQGQELRGMGMAMGEMGMLGVHPLANIQSALWAEPSHNFCIVLATFFRSSVCAVWSCHKNTKEKKKAGKKNKVLCCVGSQFLARRPPHICQAFCVAKAADIATAWSAMNYACWDTKRNGSGRWIFRFGCDLWRGRSSRQCIPNRDYNTL